MTMPNRTLLALAGAALTALWAGPALKAQSLTDAARLERARRAREEKVDPRHGAVFRLEDLLRYDPAGRPIAAAANEQPVTPPATDEEANKDYWDMRLDAARAAYARAERAAQDADAAMRDAREQPFPETYTEALDAVAEQQALRDDDAEARTQAMVARDYLAEVEAEASSGAQ